MEVSELINFLSKFDSSTRVMLKGYEEGYDDLKEVKEKDVVLNFYNDWWNGEHEALEKTAFKKFKSVKAVILK